MSDAVGQKAASVSDLAQVLSWPQDESDLVTELQGGSESAFDWLVTHYHGPVFGLIAGLVGDPCEAADITQEVFLKAFRGLGNFRRGSSLRTWLYRIAVREALNARRWWWRHHRQQTSLEVEREDGPQTIEIEDPAVSPLDLAESSEMQQIVRRGLHQVPEVFRSAVMLRDLEGLSYEEVAEVLDVSVGTVKSRILRGRQALREILAPLVERPQQTRSGHDVSSRTERRREVRASGVAVSRLSFEATSSGETGARVLSSAPGGANLLVGMDRAGSRRAGSGGGR
jgi:RNA polymerase sigma-70 factor (ECF subfamily)